MIRAIVVDDELPSLQKIEKQVCDCGVKVIGAFSRPLDALEFLKKNAVDVAFLDIEMPDMDGLELADAVTDLGHGVNIVFVTAYNQYAVEAFRLNALDYLLKPVTADRLNETIARIVRKTSDSVRPDAAVFGNVTQCKAAVQCFGKFIVRAGRDEVRFRTEKAEELLGFLIDQRGQFISRAKILDNLWEDFDGDRAVVHFNTTLHYVKKALLSYGIRISIQHDRGSYRLDVTDLCCDYLEFSSLAQRALGATAETASSYEQAAALYTGEYLSGWDHGWVTARRLLLEEQFIGLILGIARYYKDTRDYAKAARFLTEGLNHEPLHRELNYRLIETLLLAHEQVLAAKRYDLYRDGLRRKMGSEPDEGFRRLFPR